MNEDVDENQSATDYIDVLMKRHLLIPFRRLFSLFIFFLVSIYLRLRWAYMNAPNSNFSLLFYYVFFNEPSPRVIMFRRKIVVVSFKATSCAVNIGRAIS